MNFKILSIMAGLTLLYGCDQTPDTLDRSSTGNAEVNEATLEPRPSIINQLSMIRDVANLELKTRPYLEQLKQTQHDVQMAVQAKDNQALGQLVPVLQQQLNQLKLSLESLDLKTQEIDKVRKQLLAASQKALQSASLNGEIRWDQLNFNRIEQQMSVIKNETFRLMALMLPQTPEMSSHQHDHEHDNEQEHEHGDTESSRSSQSSSDY